VIRIHADFNDVDDFGRVYLHLLGSLMDIEKHKDEMVEGMKVLLYVPDEFEVVGTLVFDRVWRAMPDWTTLHYYDEEDAE
jgi:hypothetical protein